MSIMFELLGGDSYGATS